MVKSQVLSETGSDWEAIKNLMHAIMQLGGGDEDYRKLRTDQELVVKIARVLMGQADVVLNQSADKANAENQYKWVNVAMTSKNYSQANTCLALVMDQRYLIMIAQRAEIKGIRLEAVHKLEPKSLVLLLINVNYDESAQEALDRLDDDHLLLSVALQAKHYEVSKKAALKINHQVCIVSLLKNLGYKDSDEYNFDQREGLIEQIMEKLDGAEKRDQWLEEIARFAATDAVRNKAKAYQMQLAS